METNSATKAVPNQVERHATVGCALICAKHAAKLVSRSVELTVGVRIDVRGRRPYRVKTARASRPAVIAKENNIVVVSSTLEQAVDLAETRAAFSPKLGI